ncbi:hypothetical protein TCDM_05207 [Trypanosoma cruzi Dm28c]|uniref:Uncharacterized protein n=1 Tax=Trypanosoma cruzi Dm28c TaxID=1416333 RepID=V5BJA1_TRYCR|nr:hypothetical protein TCDM_05207 [Trypanosoma cruzi Dm28c]
MVHLFYSLYFTFFTWRCCLLMAEAERIFCCPCALSGTFSPYAMFVASFFSFLFSMAISFFFVFCFLIVFPFLLGRTGGVAGECSRV